MTAKQSHVIKTLLDRIAYYERVAYRANQSAEDLQKCLETIRKSFMNEPPKKASPRGWGKE